MKLLSRMLGSLPKRIVAGAIVALAVALPVAVSASQTVKIEADTKVANVTAGDTTYKNSVNASYDQVVKVEVVYNNDEAAGSGKVANNLRVKINIPSTAGKTQKITTVTSADNSNTVNGSTTVNLDGADAYLQYEPGTVVWAHVDAQTNKMVTKNLGSAGDGIVSGNGIVLENENPCQAGSVTVLARVMVPGVKIVKQSEIAGQTSKWSNNNTANPGDKLKYMITYQNTGNTQENNVVIRDSLPPKMTLVPNSTYLYNSNNPNGVLYKSDNITNGGIVIGNYAPGATAYVVFEVQIPAESALACGQTEFRNVGVAHPENMNEYYNTAITTVNKTCESQPGTPTCNALTVTKGDGRTIEAKVSYTANGATLKTVTYDFGDNSTPLTTDKTDVNYTYAKDGNYNVTANLLFSVNGKDQTVSSDSCAKTVSFTTPGTPTTPTTPGTPSELPNTGAGDVFAIFAGASVAGAIAYRLFLSRRLARR